MAIAVSWAETGKCKYAKENNCWGIMEWDRKGVRHQKKYSSYEEGKNDFIRIWKKYYKRFPDYRLATIWTGNDSPNTWLNAVKKYY